METFCVQYLKIEYRRQLSSKHFWFHYFIFSLSSCRHVLGNDATTCVLRRFQFIIHS